MTVVNQLGGTRHMTLEEVLMSMRRFLVALGAGLIVLACTESTAPRIEPAPPVASAGPRHLRWKARPIRPNFAAHRTPSASPGQESPSVLLLNEGATSTGLYSGSFWAVSGETRSLTIDCVSSADGVTAPFATLVVPSEALSERPDGTPIAPGDSVLITATVDPDYLIVSLQPSGLVFSASDPAQLWLWYNGADQDFDGDGDFDATDRYIEGELLSIWYHQSTEDPWTMLNAWHFEQSFRIDLRHFSGYAVSY